MAENLSFCSQAYRDTFSKDFTYCPRSRKSSRNYQERARKSALRKLRESNEPQLVHFATGGGKTHVGNQILKNWLSKEKGPVFWIAPRWSLLYQAARDYAANTRNGLDHIARIGGRDSPLHPLPENPEAAIHYTTLQTLWTRIQNRKPLPKPTLVIWDECHWGEKTSTGSEVMSWSHGTGAKILGLTATPRKPEHTDFKVAGRATFADLVAGGYLAAPEVETVPTGITWSPWRSRRTRDFDATSLCQLGQNHQRNDLIVDYFNRSKRRFGRTILFACSIDHAETLARQFVAMGIAARAVHCEITPAANNESIKLFRSGDISILINVEQLTLGVDIPETLTIFLCRATMSDMLFAQMIGRGARLHPPSGKTRFTVVEFTDNLERFTDQLCRAKDYFEGSTSGHWSPAATRHHSTATRTGTWTHDVGDMPDELRDLWVRNGQTFGIEFELSDRSGLSGFRSWDDTASTLLSNLARALPPELVATRPEGNDHRCWNVVRDASCGFEVTSRILEGVKGFREIALACTALRKAAEEIGLSLDLNTSTHIHLGWQGKSITEVKRMVRFVKFVEPMAATLVAPSRIACREDNYNTGRPNRFCPPVSCHYPRKALRLVRSFRQLQTLSNTFEEREERYASVNVASLEKYDTIEVRLHGGTLNAQKILLWVSLWMQIVSEVENRRNVPPMPDVKTITPNGDIVRLVKRLFPGGRNPGFLNRLRKRRAQIVAIWEKHHELNSWRNMAEGWNGTQ